jgi:alkanesulfonate monooxygenase SsuD/methylene tetrahydromethanopterin reductase-like flavin-dependent oxidoreductase (luciferase family)
LSLQLALKYDLRLPSGTARQHATQYQVALEQTEWADRLGFSDVTINEHHGTDDGYLPSPLVFAGAVAARTRNIQLNPSAIIAVLHDPLRLAEDLAVLDLVSEGRVTVTIGAGYREAEMAMFGRRLSGRFSAVERLVETLRSAWTGEPFEYEGRTVRVSPRPAQRPGPPILLAGVSEGAARRAARIADGFAPIHSSLHEAYREACRANGRPDPGPGIHNGPKFLYIADDPERAWHEIAPACLHEAQTYAAWGAEAGISNGFRAHASVADLRTDPRYAVVTADECVEILLGLGPRGRMAFHPLCGGMDPDLSWRSLRLFEDKVLPRLKACDTQPEESASSVK